jgi:hypothetical protein
MASAEAAGTPCASKGWTAAQRRVPGTTATDQQPVGPRPFEPIAPGARDRLRREGHQRRHEVVPLTPGRAPLFSQGLGLRRAVALAAGRLGRRSPQELVVEQSLQQTGVDPPARGARAVSVHALPAFREHLHHPVDQRVGRAHVEGDDVVGRRAARDPGQVGDPAEVQDRAAFPGIGEGREVEEGCEGRTFAARREVAGPEVRHRRARRSLGDHRGISDLETGVRLRMVRDRLAVGCDGVDGLEGETRVAGDGRRTGGEALAQRHVEAGQLAQRLAGRHPSRGQPVDPVLEIRRKRVLAIGE